MANKPAASLHDIKSLPLAALERRIHAVLGHVAKIHDVLPFLVKLTEEERVSSSGRLRTDEPRVVSNDHLAARVPPLTPTAPVS